MIIGFDGSRAFDDKKTGTELYSYQILKNLAKIDRVNTYKVYLRPTSKNLKEIENREEELKKVFPDNFQFITIKYYRFWTQLGLSLQTFKDELDLLFVPSHTVPLIKKPGLKTIMTVHDLGAEYLPNLHQLKQALYLKWITNFQLKSNKYLIAVSESTKKDIIKKVRIEPSKIRVIYEGVDTDFFKKPSDVEISQVLKKYGLEKGKYFFFVGTIQPRKNLCNLIEAFSKLLKNDLKLALAGGKGWKSDEIYEMPKKLNIENSVNFLGRVDDSELPSLYSASFAFVFPSLFEGFGLPILEAMACETPVLTSNTSSLPEVAGDGAVLVSPEGSNDILRGLMLLLDSSYRKKLINLGLKQVKKFSWEKAAKETLELFEEANNG